MIGCLRVKLSSRRKTGRPSAEGAAPVHPDSAWPRGAAPGLTAQPALCKSGHGRGRGGAPRLLGVGEPVALLVLARAAAAAALLDLGVRRRQHLDLLRWRRLLPLLDLLLHLLLRAGVPPTSRSPGPHRRTSQWPSNIRPPDAARLQQLVRYIAAPGHESAHGVTVSRLSGRRDAADRLAGKHARRGKTTFCSISCNETHGGQRRAFMAAPAAPLGSCAYASTRASSAHLPATRRTARGRSAGGVPSTTSQPDTKPWCGCVLAAEKPASAFFFAPSTCAAGQT